MSDAMHKWHIAWLEFPDKKIFTFEFEGYFIMFLKIILSPKHFFTHLDLIVCTAEGKDNVGICELNEHCNMNKYVKVK